MTYITTSEVASDLVEAALSSTVLFSPQSSERTLVWMLLMLAGLFDIS